MPCVSPITRDLAINGIGLIAVGIGGLVAVSFVVTGGPANAIVPFLIIALVFGLAQVVVSGGWPRSAVDEAQAVPPGPEREERAATVRRCGVPTVLAFVLIAMAFLAWPQFASLLAGLAFAAGMTDMRARAWVRSFQTREQVQVLREVTPLPFATSRKPIWTEPRAPDAG
jgi:hypothetical protein